jgi:hypothetical protein
MDVLIVGGGFAGVQAARSVTRSLPGASVTLIDRTGYATMIPALPDALSGRIATDRLARPLDETLGDEVQLRVDSVVRIDGDARRVHTAEETEMIAVSTTCMAEVIGDDLNAFIGNAKSAPCAPAKLPSIRTSSSKKPLGKTQLVGSSAAAAPRQAALRFQSAFYPAFMKTASTTV